MTAAGTDTWSLKLRVSLTVTPSSSPTAITTSAASIRCANVEHEQSRAASTCRRCRSEMRYRVSASSRRKRGQAQVELRKSSKALTADLALEVLPYRVAVARALQYPPL